MSRHLAAVDGNEQQPTQERDAYRRAHTAIEAAAQAVTDAASSGSDALLSAALMRLAEVTQASEELTAAFRLLSVSELAAAALIEVGRALERADTTLRVLPAV